MRRRPRAPSRSCSSAMSPTISSMTSSMVTMPAWSPYSSRTTASCPSCRSRVSSGSSRSESGTTIGRVIRCLTLVVWRSPVGRATACLTWTVPITTSSWSSTGKREWPVWRASSITAQARSLASRLIVRTRGVMISPAVRVPNSTDRSISSAVSASSVPSSADREISEASSVDDRADRSSSWGSIPRRRTIALADPLRTRMGPRITAVKRRWKPCVARAVSIGRAMAKFFGTSSAKIIVTRELIVSPIATATGCTAFSGSPRARTGPLIKREMAGSARKPMARFVIVMPTWAPDSCVDSERRARSTPAAGASPSSAARATLDRSTVTKENSAATKTPAAMTSRTETPSNNQAVSTLPRPSAERSRVRGDCQSRPWAGRGPSDSEDVCRETLQTAPRRPSHRAGCRPDHSFAGSSLSTSQSTNASSCGSWGLFPVMPSSPARHSVRSSTVSWSADQPSARSSSHAAQAAL